MALIPKRLVDLDECHALMFDSVQTLFCALSKYRL
jgi:hypothetical protein